MTEGWAQQNHFFLSFSPHDFIHQSPIEESKSITPRNNSTIPLLNVYVCIRTHGFSLDFTTSYECSDAIVVGVTAVVFVFVAAFPSAAERFSSCWRPNLSWWWVKEPLVRIIGKWWTSREKSVDEDWDFVRSFILSLNLSILLLLLLSLIPRSHVHCTVRVPSLFLSPLLCAFVCFTLSRSEPNKSMSMCQSIPLILRFNGFKTFILLFHSTSIFLLFHSPFAIAKLSQAIHVPFGWMSVYAVRCTCVS